MDIQIVDIGNGFRIFEQVGEFTDDIYDKDGDVILQVKGKPMVIEWPTIHNSREDAEFEYMLTRGLVVRWNVRSGRMRNAE